MVRARELARADREMLPPASQPTFDLTGRGGGYIGATVRGLENRWREAIAKRDLSTLDDLVGDDFTRSGNGAGRVGSKSAFLRQLKTERGVRGSASARGMTVQVHGGKIAVVTGVTKEKGIGPDGKRFTVSRGFTDTWAERNGRWQCIASRETPLPKQ